MNTNREDNFTFSDIKEYATILVIKVLLAAAVFGFSTVIADTVSAVIRGADSWLEKSSQSVSRNIIDLYR